MIRIPVQGFTIDPVEAKDLDDALNLKKTDAGWSLQVSITDISSFIKKGSALDKRAYQKGFSQYFKEDL